MNRIGLVEHPAGYSCRPRTFSTSLRLAAAVILGAFVIVGVATTVYSLGAYCLTSHAGFPAP